MFQEITSLSLPSCSGNVRWTLERVLKCGKDKYGDIFDYSKINIICNICGYTRLQTIHNHIHHGGWASCSEQAPRTLERLLVIGPKLYCNFYDYSRVKSEHIKNSKSRIRCTARIQSGVCSRRITILCRICFKEWNPRIDDNIYGRRGCRNCRKSKGESACEVAFQSLNIIFEKEHIIHSLPNSRYDFMFKREDKIYLLEFDSEKHFEYQPFFFFIGNVTILLQDKLPIL